MALAPCHGLVEVGLIYVGVSPSFHQQIPRAASPPSKPALAWLGCLTSTHWGTYLSEGKGPRSTPSCSIRTVRHQLEFKLRTRSGQIRFRRECSPLLRNKRYMYANNYKAKRNWTAIVYIIHDERSIQISTKLRCWLGAERHKLWAFTFNLKYEWLYGQPY